MIEACLTNKAAINLELFLNDCAKALKINPKNTKAFYQSAKALYMLDKLDEALGCCDHALLSDFVTAFNEDTTFLDYLEVIFENPAPRDIDGKYRSLNNLQIYFGYDPSNSGEMDAKPKLIKIGKKCILKEALSHPQIHC
nr:12321_t:CDS:2 [Entrophospora candida]